MASAERRSRCLFDATALGAMLLGWLVVASAARAQEAPPQPDPLVVYEEAIRLERVRGDLLGAAQAYEEALRRLDVSSPRRADALFRLGALRIRLGDVARAREPFRELLESHGDRRDLLARADALLSVPLDADRAERVVRPLTAVDGSALRLAAALGQDDRLHLGEVLPVTRDGKDVALAVVVRLAPGAAILKVVRGEAQAGDGLALPRASAGDAEPDRSAAADSRAAAMLTELAGLEDALGSADGLEVDRFEVRVILAEREFVESLPYSFRPLALIEPGREPSPTIGTGAVAKLSARDLAGFEARVVRGLREGGGATLYRTEALSLPLGQLRTLRLGGLRMPAGLATTRFEGLLLALQRLESKAPGEALLTIDATVVDRVSEGAAFPGPLGTLAPETPRTQRVRGQVIVAPTDRALLVGGLDDPFATRPGERSRDLIVVIIAPPRAP